MASYISVQVQVFKDDVEILRYEENEIDVKFYSHDDIIEYAKACLVDNQLCNETGLFTIDLVFYGQQCLAMSTKVHLEQAHIVQVVSSQLDEVCYRA